MKAGRTIRITVYAFTALWGYAGSIKLVFWARSRAEMHKQPFPEAIGDILFWAIPLMELSIAAMLLMPRLRTWGLRISLALIAVFTAYLALVVNETFGEVPCACGGILSGMGHTTHIVFNGIFIILGCIAMVLAHKSRHGGYATPDASRKEDAITSG